MRVVMFQEIIAPYRIPVFNEIHQKGGFEFKVFFLKETQSQRHWPIYWDDIKFPYEVLPGFAWEGRNLRTLHFNFGVLKKLSAGKFDVIVTGGWHQPSYYLSLLYAKSAKKRFLFWSESNQRDLRKTGILHKFIRKKFVRWSSGAIVAGKASRDYLLHLGAKATNIWTAPNAIDTTFYSTRSAEFKKEKSKLKKEMSLPDKLIFYAGRLVEEKGVGDLLKAYAIVSQKVNSVGLVLCGEGEKRPEYEEFCRKENLKNVVFTGFLTREKLALYYGISDLFVLCSYTEPWGLVVNEALSAGLPVICSKKAGAADDLVHCKKNGYLFEPGDIKAISDYLMILLTDEKKCMEFGLNSMQIIKDYSPSRCAEGFINAVLAIR